VPESLISGIMGKALERSPSARRPSASLPKSKREQLTALLALEILVEGITFEIGHLRKIPSSPALITRVLRALQDAKVIDKVSYGKYIFNDEFLRSVSVDVFPRMRRSGLIQYPAMTVFDICRMGEWSDQEFELFLHRLKDHRVILQIRKKIGDGSWSLR
jgi:hypothetical protein